LITVRSRVMHKIYFRFYEELNDFLPKDKRKKRFEHHYIDRASVKDVIESFGVPHTEVDLILVNGKSAGFNYIINDGDEISVYPVFESLDISEVQHLRPKPLRRPKFICDVHLGKLARYLRMMGFDILYKNSFNDEEIVRTSLKERRAILTRDRGILKRRDIAHGYFIRSIDAEKQTKEVVRRFDLQSSIKEFTRCLECNHKLIKISKAKIEGELPLKVTDSQKEFFKCPGCAKLYWKGTHYQKMLLLVQKTKSMKY